MQNHALVEQRTSSIFGGIVIGSSTKKKNWTKFTNLMISITLGLHLHLDHGLTDPNTFDNNNLIRNLGGGESGGHRTKRISRDAIS